MQLVKSHRNVRSSPPPIPLGAQLKMWRDRYRISQTDVVKHLPATVSQRRYSSFELDERAPRFDELPAIYAALYHAGIRFTLQDRWLFIDLAKQKFEAKKTHKVQPSGEEWERLRVELARIDQLADDPALRTQATAIRSTFPLRMETNHLLGRETWLASLFGTIQQRSSIKVISIQGPPGSGKTSEVHRIANHFLQSVPRYYVVLCELSPIELERLEPDIALELLLGDILEVVGSPYASMPTMSLHARVKYVLECLAKADRAVLIILDNAEHILSEHGDLAPVWKHFLAKFVQVRHHASLVLATKEWPGSFMEETQLVMHAIIPPFSNEEGSLLLQRLGLQGLPEEQLGSVVEAVGGIPQCLEWVAKLVQEPWLRNGWAAFEEEAGGEMVRLMSLLEDPSLFGGPVAERVTPLLERVVKRLSPEAHTALRELAVSPVPLGSPALRMLYHNPTPLKELRDASLLVPYPKRVQLLPMVAALIRQGLTDEQVRMAEERLIQALVRWLESSPISVREQGMVITELACLLLRRHRLLAAAELVLYYGWLSSHVGQMLRLARRVQQVLQMRPWNDVPETERETEYGGLLLHYYLASYVGEEIDDHRRAEAYERILVSVSAGQVTVSPLMQVYLLDHILRDYATAERFEEAKRLFDTCLLRLGPLLAGDRELHATLLSKQAALSNRWSGYAKSNGLLEDAQRMQEQAIAIYRSCLTLLEQALQKAEEGTLRKSTLRKKQATFLNNLAYQLNVVGHYEEALKMVGACIALKEQGYAERDSLAASYGEKSQILAALGHFQEALRLDERAREEIRRCAEAGDTLAQEEQWIYQVNQGRLYLLLGRVDEAACLLQEAEPKVQPRRSIFQNMAQNTLREIKQARVHSAPAPFQLDWRWVERFRALSAYDAYWWWAHAGPFTAEEQERWDHLFFPPVDEETKNQLRKLLLASRDRELEAALVEHREPRLHYPAIEIDLVRQRIADFLVLDADVNKHEPNVLVRRLYYGAIEDEVCFLRMIEATYEGNTERFWELTQQLYPPPTMEEMHYAIDRVKQIVLQGLQREDTAHVSRQVIGALRDGAGLLLDVSPDMEVTHGVSKGVSHASFEKPRMVSAQATKRFFEAILQESGYEGWKVVLDPNASGPRVESGLRQIFLQDRPLPPGDIREYVSHELLGHVTRSIAGERSLLGLLAMGTKGYMPTEEGLADYHERHIAALHGDPFDDSGTWLGSLSVGLASGVGGGEGMVPQTFTSHFSFFEPFLLLYRLLWRDDEDRPTAEQCARRNALTRCLRTYRGVPDVQRVGICFTKDVVYLRGHLQIERAVAEDPAVLDRLAVGKVALDLLPDLQELGIVAPEHVSTLRKRAYDPELDNYILAFEREDSDSSPQD
jgi:tetratricopeptide (TPR) repeat protein